MIAMKALCHADKNRSDSRKGKILQNLQTPKTNCIWSPAAILSHRNILSEKVLFSPATLKNDACATCQLGEITVENKGNGHTQGKVLFRPEQFSLAKKIQRSIASFTVRLSELNQEDELSIFVLMLAVMN